MPPAQAIGTWCQGPVPTLHPATPTATGDQPVAVHLMRVMREEFRKCGGAEDVPISAASLGRHWYALADSERKRSGGTHLPEGLRQAVSLRAVQALEEVGLRRPSRMYMDEWVHFGLLLRAQDMGHMPTPAAAAQINAALCANLRRYPSILHDVQWLFEVADCTHSGVLGLADITEMYERRLWRLRPFPERQDTPGKARHQLSEAELDAGTPVTFARQIMEAMDLDGDRTRVTYPELVSYCLGQRRQDVVLHLYDLSDGLATTLSPWLLGRTLGGIWHTGIVVHGREYYFGGEIYQDKPGETRFGTPTAKLTLGITLLSLPELEHFLVNQVRPEFTQKAYSVLHHNCNHFTNRVAKYLVGRQIPEEVLTLPDCASDAPAVLQPLLQRWFGSVDARAKATCSRALGQRLESPRASEPPWFPGGSCVTILPSSNEFSPGILGQVVPGQPAVRQNPSATPDAEAVQRVWVRYFEPPRVGRRPTLRTELVDCSRILAPLSTSGVGVSSSTVVASFKQTLRTMEATAGTAPETPQDGGADGSRPAPSKLLQLTAEGFDPRVAEAALARANGNPERAAALLCAHGLEKMPPTPKRPASPQKAATPVRTMKPQAAEHSDLDESDDDAADARCLPLSEQMSKLLRLPSNLSQGLSGGYRRLPVGESPKTPLAPRGSGDAAGPAKGPMVGRKRPGRLGGA